MYKVRVSGKQLVNQILPIVMNALHRLTEAEICEAMKDKFPSIQSVHERFARVRAGDPMLEYIEVTFEIRFANEQDAVLLELMVS